ncbi:diguanylate cyclase [Klebsiella pneumoniae]|nr:diguanylate cyclase [Klebsiella pneumoniae]
MSLFNEIKVDSEKYQSPLSLAVIDIDYFKSYNDDFGHQEGDLALKIVATSLTNSLTEKGNSCKIWWRRIHCSFTKHN